MSEVHAFGKALCDLIGIDAHLASRITIDVEPGMFPRVVVEMVPSEPLKDAFAYEMRRYEIRDITDEPGAAA